MNAEKNTDHRFSAAWEFFIVALIKITLALLVFSFSTLIAETMRLYAGQADNWMKDTSRVISLKIVDLYR